LKLERNPFEKVLKKDRNPVKKAVKLDRKLLKNSKRRIGILSKSPNAG